MKTIQPLNPQDFPLPDNTDNVSPRPADDPGKNEAADLVRKKLASLYASEPDVVTEAIESVQTRPDQRSRHQKFMAELAASDKPFAQIQTEWHNYYVSLSDKEKHEVWNEFYSAQQHKPVFDTQSLTPEPLVNPAAPTVFGVDLDQPKSETKTKTDAPVSVANLKKQLTSRVGSRGKLSKKQHLKSLGFGLGVGTFTVLLLLFGFFNERFIAPFITPSRTVSSTPLISDGLGGSVGTEPKLIIPKINVELPVVYGIQSIEEKDIQKGLEEGVVHYSTTSLPGEQGNGAIFGHSSNNILNRGKYKFAFVLLSRLEAGDTFYIEKDGVRYVYRVFQKRVVPPTDISVLNNVPGKTSTMTLITCDPPGTTINRLVVWGEQISPDPAKNAASTALEIQKEPEILAGNAPSLWSRIWPF